MHPSNDHERGRARREEGTAPGACAVGLHLAAYHGVTPMITNTQSGTNVHEVADGIYRINTPISLGGTGRFNFNQYLVTDDEPLLFHTGPRAVFPLVQEAVARVIPVESLRYV